MFKNRIIKRFKVSIKRLKLTLFHLRKLSLRKSSAKKCIIVCFNGYVPHGGLVDRLKGIISFYEISKILDYDFYIQFDNPFRLEIFLEPNLVNWKIENVKWHLLDTELVYVINNFEINPLEKIKSSKANVFLVYANVDYSKIFYPHKDDTQLEKEWNKNFFELFKKSAILEECCNNILVKPYISFHARFANLMGDFVDTTNKVLLDEEKSELCEVLFKEINKVSDTHNHFIYVLSDSTCFINFLKVKMNICTTPGIPFHMDNFKRITNFEGQLKTFIDFFALANSEKVYFLHLKPMYNSSFSKYASIVGNTQYERIDL